MPLIINGGQFSDERGTISYFNDLDLSPVKRMYIIAHTDTSTVRAWQGHKQEHKWFHVLAGSFKMVLIKPDNWEFPSTDLGYQDYNLTDKNNEVLHVPGGYATGFKALEANSRLLVFSNFTVSESQNDDFRFDKNNWYNW